MSSRKLLSVLFLLSALPLVAPSAPAAAQADMPPPPPRAIGDLSIDGQTTAPLQVLRSVTLEEKPKKIFSYLANAENWPGWFEFVGSVRTDSSDAKRQGRAGTVRHFSLLDGGTISERIVAFSEPEHLAWSIQPDNAFGLEKHLGVLSLQAISDGRTVLTWSHYFDHPQADPVGSQIGAGVEGALEHFRQRFGGEIRGGATGLGKLVLTQARTTRAPVDKVWNLTANGFGDVDRWASVISHASLERPESGDWVGTKRTCEVPGTPGFKETMLTYDEKARTFSYQVIEGLPPFVTRGVNTWTLTPAPRGGTTVAMSLELDIAPGTPAPAVDMVKSQFHQVLDLTADELEFYLDTGRPHPRKAQSQQAMGR